MRKHGRDNTIRCTLLNPNIFHGQLIQVKVTFLENLGNTFRVRPVKFCENFIPSEMRPKLATVAVYLFFFINLAAADSDYGEACDPKSGNPIKCNTANNLECIPNDRDNSGTCGCPSGSHWEELSELPKCRKNVGTECAVGLNEMECALNANCEKNNCACADRFETSKEFGYQRCVGSHGAVCFPNNRCNNDSKLFCAKNICGCQVYPSTHWSSNRQKCLIQPNNPCTTDDDCVENSRCVMPELGFQQCRCLDDYTEHNGECLVAFGKPCAGTRPCNNGGERTECIAGICGCPTNEMNFKDGICKKLVGQECDPAIPDACYGAGVCHEVDKTCICPSTAIELVDKTCETPSGTVNGYCRDRSDCAEQDFLKCYLDSATDYGLCNCKEGMIFENGQCRIKAGENCLENRNCVQNAVCVAGKCECRNNSMQTGDQFCHVLNGANCGSDSKQICNSELGLICPDDKTCKCPVGQVWEYSESAKKMRCVALVSGNCSESDSFCTKNADCTKAGICDCKAGFSATPINSTIVESRKCLRVYNNTCKHEIDPCNPYDFLTCSKSGKCECLHPSQQIYDSDKGKCLSKFQGFCGILEENHGLNQMCAKYSKCMPDSAGLFRCVCDKAVADMKHGGVCPDPNATDNNIAIRTSGSFSTIILIGSSLSHVLVQY